MEIVLSPRQAAFVAARADEVLFGGAAGGGKSYGQLADALIYAMKYAGSKQILFRRTYPELEKSLIRAMRDIYPTSLFTYRKSAHSGVFCNGSVLDFGSLEQEDDIYKYQSAEYDVIRFDELTHFTEQMYVYLLSRLRGVRDFPRQVKSTCNPGGIGHGWVKSRFIDIGEGDREYHFTGGSRIFLPSTVQDNPFLMQHDPDYIKRLNNLSDKDKKALLYGQWDIFDGQFFSDWDRAKHVIEPFSIPSDWKKYFVMDYGLDMLAGYLIALSPFDRAVVCKEIYEGKDNGGEGHIVSSAAARIKEFTKGENVVQYLAPPDLWSRQKDSGKSIAELFREQGIRLTRAPNTRVSGWMQLKEWLRVQECEDGEKRPSLQIFSHCINLIRTLPSLVCDPKCPDDVARTPHELTHGPDALRYFVASCPRNTPKTQSVKTYNFTFEKPKPRPCGLGDKIKII